MMSSAILPSDPVTSARKLTASAKPSRADVPGRHGHAEAKFFAKCVLHLKALVAERGQRSRGASELADEDARFQLLQAFGVTVEHRKPDRGLVAERDRQRLLQMGTSAIGVIAVTLRQIGENPAQCRDILLDKAQAFAELQDHGHIP